ncbi:hypothetical protein EYC56_20955 [Xanthomonas oryzae]|nr:hypothetical protein EYR26_20900 [Xanthomonas oryzae]QBH01282.1 hypothetical protein EYC56_20955 [Xanthomonas oryzae]QBH05165.1 hypothetical protein EYC57_19860 [Xanthomonas oryzae]
MAGPGGFTCMDRWGADVAMRCTLRCAPGIGADVHEAVAAGVGYEDLEACALTDCPPSHWHGFALRRAHG